MKVKVRKIDLSADEFIAGVIGLGPELLGTYWAINLLVYSSGRMIDDDDPRLFALLGVHRNRLARLISDLEIRGKLQRNGNQIGVKRALNEIEKAEKRIISRQINGALGGRPKENQADTKPDGFPTEKLSLTTTTNNHHQKESIGPNGPHSEPVRRPTPRRLAEQMVEVWREVVCPILPNVTKLTDKRIASACRRLADEFNGSLDDWRGFLQRVRGSPVLTGENDRGWRADFDFCTRLDAVLHIIEGRYDDKRNGSGGELSERRAPDKPAPAVPEEFWSQYPDVRPPKH